MLPSYVVCPSVCNVGDFWSCTFGYFESSYTDNYLGVFAPRSHNVGNLVQGETSLKFGWNRVGVAVLAENLQKTNISETVQDRTRVADRKLHTPFRLVLKTLTTVMHSIVEFIMHVFF